MLHKPILSFLMILAVLTPAAVRADKASAWVEVDSPNFRVVSDAGQKKAEEAAVQFETIRAVFRNTIAVASEHPTNVVTVLALKDEDSFREFFPQFWAAKNNVHPAGLFYGADYKTYMAIRFDAGYEDSYGTIYHEYYHSLTVPYVPNMPLWVAEGMAEFFGHTQVMGKKTQVGQIDQNLLVYLQQQRMPLEMLMKVDRSSPYYNEQNKTSIFYAESWALVHYLMMADNGVHRNQFADFLQRTGNNESVDQAAGEAFGSLNKLEAQLNTYIGRFVFQALELPTPQVDAKSFPTRALHEADVDAVEGDSFIRQQKFDSADMLLKKALALDAENVPARESLGIQAFAKGNYDEAERWMREAVDRHTNDYLTYYYDAELNLRRGATDEKTLATAEDSLRHCISLNANFAPAYASLASLEVRDPNKWPDVISLSQKAIQMEPGTMQLRLNFARELMEMNRFADAQKLALSAQSAAKSPEEGAEVASFISELANMQSEIGKAAKGATVYKRGALVEPTPAPVGTASGPATTRDGKVEQAGCSHYELNVSLSTSTSEVLNLHATNYLKVEFWTQDSSKANFDPCSDLGGQRARITYVRTTGSNSDGEIQRIEIQAPSN